MEPSWGTYNPLNDSDPILTRRNNLVKLAKKYKWRIDIKIMQNILDTSIKQGGTTSYSIKNDNLYTGFQIIITNKNSTLWVKIPDFQNWTSIDLNVLFRISPNRK